MVDPEDCCGACGKPLPEDRHWRRTFCNKRCNNVYFNGLTAEARAEVRAGRTCAHCGGTFDGRRGDQLYCSLRCRAYASVARNCGTRQCLQCAGAFDPKTPVQKYCGTDCYQAGRRGE